MVPGSVQPVRDPLKAPQTVPAKGKLNAVGAAPARCRVTSNVEGPDGTPPSAREGNKGAHERWKQLLTIVPIVIGLVLLVLLIVAVVTSQSTT